MAALSIRRMNDTLVFREQLMDAHMKATPTAKREIHYWHVERKARRGKKWIFVGRFFCTKAEMAETWVRDFRGRDDKHRLVHMMRY